MDINTRTLREYFASLPNGPDTELVGADLSKVAAANFVAPGDLAAVATTGAYEDLSGSPVLGTAATRDDAYFVQPARTITAGDGLSGGGDLSANRSFAILPSTTGPLLDIVRPEYYYLPEDGGDWEPAFMRAQTAGRVIDCKPGATYEISQAIDNVSNRIWKLNRASIINSRTDANVARQSVFLMGNIHPDMCDYANQGVGNNLSCHNMGPITVGATKGLLTTPAERSIYSVGQFVLVRHTLDVAGTDGRIPVYSQFNKITQIDVDGTLHWEDPILESISSACISPLGGTANIDDFMNAPWRMVENVTIEGGSLGGRSLLSTRTGAWKSVISDIRAVGTPLFLYAVNALVHCTSERIFGNSESRLFEAKGFSQDSVFRDIGGAMTGNLTANAVEVGEQSNRCQFENIRAVVTPNNSQAVSVARIGGFLNTIDGFEFVHGGTTAGDIVQFGTNDYTGYGPRRNTLKNGRIVASTTAAPRHIHVASEGGTERPHDYTIHKVSMVGATSTAQSVYVGQSLDGGSVTDSEMPYSVAVLGGAKAPQRGGNRITGKTALTVTQGTGTPEAVVTGNIGDMYARTDTTDRMPMRLKTNTDATPNSWRVLQTLSGYASNGDVDVTLNNNSPLWQHWDVPLTADRFGTLPAALVTESAGWPFELWKVTTSGAGKLAARLSGGTVLAEIPAGSKGVIFCRWTGSAWRAQAVIFS